MRVYQFRHSRVPYYYTKTTSYLQHETHATITENKQLNKFTLSRQNEHFLLKCQVKIDKIKSIERKIKNIMTNSELRASAKEILTGKYKSIIIFSFILSVLTAIVNQIGATFGPVRDLETWQIVDPGNPVMYQIFNLLTGVLAMFIAVSLTNAFIKIIKGEVLVYEKDLLFGFAHEPIRTVIALFLTSLFTFLWSLLFIIPGIMKGYSYSMTTYLLIKTDLDASDTISRSKVLMQGNRARLFFLDLSYLPEYILGIFTLFILWFWTSARHQTARTLFFNDLFEGSADPVVQ